MRTSNSTTSLFEPIHKIKDVKQEDNNSLFKRIITGVKEDLNKEKVNNVQDILQYLIEVKGSLMDCRSKIVDQVEKQVKELKSSILALNEALPVDKLMETAIIVYNTSRDKFLEQLLDEQVLLESKLADSINQSHIHKNLVSKNSLHGLFIFFRLGHVNKAESIKHANALTFLASYAHKNCFHIYFNVDSAAVIGLKSYSKLPDRINDWVREYKKSAFFNALKKIKPDYKRRLSNIFNDYIINTDLLEKKFQVGSRLRCYDKTLIDEVCFAPPVSIMAKILIKNFEELGFSGKLYGQRSALSIDSYNNFSPSQNSTKRCLSENQYTLTLWNYDLLYLPKLTKDCQLTPLQRQLFIDGDNETIKEKLSFTEAQTLLEYPNGFKNLKPSDLKKAIEGGKIKKDKYFEEARQAMFNSLTTALVQDMIERGLIILTYAYVGEPESVVQENFEQDVIEFMTIYCNMEKDGGYAFDAGQPIKALKDYDIIEIGAEGDTAFVRISISPNETIRKIYIEIDTPPSYLYNNPNEPENIGRE